MKKFKKSFAIIFTMIAASVIMTNCTKHDQILDQNAVVTPEAVLNTDTLYSVSGTPSNVQPIGGAAWNGDVTDWANAPSLTVHATVPDLGNGTFTGYVGNATDITMRSMYDATNIYFLVEFNADQMNAKSAQWYFNSTLHLWTQEVTNYETPVASTVNGAGTNYNINSDGTLRPLFAQDQFVMMFNISTPNFRSLSCYGSCHVNSSYGSSPIPEGGVMYTNGPTERLDCWRARTLQVVNVNQLNDCFIDDGASVGLGLSGTLNKNEVHGDWQVNNGSSSTVPPSLQSAQAPDGGFTNRQNKTITGLTTKENIPIWVIPSAAGVNPYFNSAIMISDTLPGGRAVKVIAVDTMGVLTLADLTTIDPNVGTDYKQIGSGNGARCVPGSIIGAYTGSRGDVTANAFYTGTGWRMLFKRKLTTDETTNDVDFASHNNQPFGVGAMFNGADNQHAIVAGLMLSFK